jgi:alkylation response protein AidB-like acyl-CoA dehydrogenase
MSDKYFSRRNMDFTLFEVLKVTDLTQYDYFNAHDRDTFGMVLDTASDIAEKIARPAYVDSDRNPPELENGQVKVHQGVHEFVKTFSEAGLMAAPFSNEWGGMQMPKSIAAASEFILGSAHNSFIMYCDLTKGSANLIYTFGTQEQKAVFLPKMLTGEWLGTMCLTETQAGSSLSDVATMAYPQADGSYKIVGQKIFISAGDHDVTDNIIHLVLARIEGAMKGTKGISLFIVPKKRENTEGGTLVFNDVTPIGIYHKMGQKATPAMHLEFGAKNDCTGYLIGEANRGLPHMFLMMNGARLGVGMGGIHIASAAYYASLQYAKERPQGRRLNEKSSLGEPTTIIHHPDVRRMLLYQKALMEGGLSFILQCYKYLDLEKAHAHDPSVKKEYNDLLELLTPVAKTFGAEMGFFSVSQGVQVFGGYGYTEDFELEQLLRDCRIMSLYEGTTGIQAQALLGRQVVGMQGRSLIAWYNEVAKDVHEAENIKSLKPYWNKQMKAMRQLQKVTAHLFKVATKGNTEVFLSDANLYMEYFGILNVSWQWLKQAIVAHKALEAGSDLGEDKVFYQSKIQTMQFYFHYEVPRLKGLAERLMDKTVLTVFDDKKEVLI